MSDAPTADPLVIVRRLSKSYVSGTETLRILTDLDLEVHPGTSLAIIGESGSGKSTLLNIIGALDRADSGSVRVGSFDLSALSEKNLNQYRSARVGFIFQFHYLLKDFTALENVMLPAYMAGVPKKVALERAQGLLRDVRLEGRARHFPSQLSGGERQRVAVARALVNDPELVLADEPTGNLDRGNSEAVAELLFLCVEKRGRTLILVTHDEAVASRAGTRRRLDRGVLS